MTNDVDPIPAGYHTATPYLIVDDGNAQIEFMEKAFGATVTHCMRDGGGRVRHADLQIGDSHIMVGGAQPPTWPALNAMVYLYVPNVDEVYAAALKAGAESLEKPSDQFYGDRNGGVRDRNGNIWWISTHVEDVSPEELERRAAGG